MRKISILTMILTAVLTVVGCNKTFEMDLPLAVSSRVIDLTKDAGTTHIMIFADGDWTANSRKLQSGPPLTVLTETETRKLSCHFLQTTACPEDLPSLWPRVNLKTLSS